MGALPLDAVAKLKVFRTPIGFHDAYVATTSRKAALAAWGATKDLFARGAAEEVTDPALTQAPLATPGAVVKVSRGSRDEQFAALPRTKRSGRAGTLPRTPAAKPKPVEPKPSRALLEDAEQALAAAGERHERERAAIADEEAALARRKRELERNQGADLARLERERDSEATEYREALDAWRRASG